MDLFDLTALELGAAIRRREVGVVEATRACLDRMSAMEGTVNAFITVTEKEALARAEQVQRGVASG